MLFGLDNWSLKNNDLGIELNNIRSFVSKKTTDIENVFELIDGSKQIQVKGKYLNYEIIVKAFTIQDWYKKYCLVDGTVCEFTPHVDNSTFKFNIIVESTEIFFIDNNIYKPRIKLKLLSESYQNEALTTTPTQVTRAFNPRQLAPFGSSDWEIYGNDIIRDTKGFVEYELNKPDNVIHTSVVTGKRSISRRGTVNNFKVTIKNPTSTVWTKLQYMNGREVYFKPFSGGFGTDCILHKLEHEYDNDQYRKGIISFTLTASKQNTAEQFLSSKIYAGVAKDV